MTSNTLTWIVLVIALLINIISLIAMRHYAFKEDQYASDIMSFIETTFSPILSFMKRIYYLLIIITWCASVAIIVFCLLSVFIK